MEAIKRNVSCEWRSVVVETIKQYVSEDFKDKQKFILEEVVKQGILALQYASSNLKYIVRAVSLLPRI
eukprot:13232176-Heterocapsa_arctica.AAC.1